MKNILLITLLGGLFINNLSAQIYFDNPSFEDTTMTNSTPEYWINCGASPDVQPAIIGLSTRASNGQSFIGLTALGFNWIEAIGQVINSGLDTIPQYFEIDAAYAYQAPISATIPSHFEVWLGNNDCERAQMIYISPALDSTWHRYTINFTPDTIYNTITFSSTLESTSQYPPYIFLDNLSAIYEGYQPPLSTPTVQAADAITVSPNPSTGLYYINQSSDAPLLVYDINGQLLQHYAPHTAQIDLSHLAAGLYILSIGTDKQRLLKL